MRPESWLSSDTNVGMARKKSTNKQTNKKQLQTKNKQLHYMNTKTLQYLIKGRNSFV